MALSAERFNERIEVLRRTISEKDEEIEQLQREVAFMASIDYLHSLKSEIARLNDLLDRAVDALEGYNSVLPSVTAQKILAELRKDAQKVS